ncbi:hypothetical protein SAMN06264364_10235 [Quadrisphaera granulorum]|uniref:Uncharacterized protein n=1 Tax=Quadrisphaera granulorum TaxID=317664 RepID=A0A316ADI3_9ACTN|nr:hypothetical protein [Quadrisphaera granulorum]PWJ55672.1 hypothetical protein BXY45_10235 [Quadrisphaera granulorum]SZE95169.1 hypothetical protein SAMN06264364_10235 [Quadrisphaera granulorum]
MPARRRLRDVLARRSPDDLELGEGGVWRRLHDRFRRAVDRYHQLLEGVPDGALRDALEGCGARLAICLDDVRAACVAEQASSPSSGLEVPGGAAGEHHARLSRAATLAAQAAEAVTMARVRARTDSTVLSDASAAEAADRAVAQVEALVHT